MLVRQIADRTQIAVIEDGVMVEHYVNRNSNQSYVGNVYLGRVQNVLPSMEAAFVDIGKAPNPLCLCVQTVFLKNPVGFSVPFALGLFRD